MTSRDWSYEILARYVERLGHENEFETVDLLIAAARRLDPLPLGVELKLRVLAAKLGKK